MMSSANMMSSVLLFMCLARQSCGVRAQPKSRQQMLLDTEMRGSLWICCMFSTGTVQDLGSFALERVAQQCVPADFPGDQTNGPQDSREPHGILGRVPHHDHLLGTRHVASLHCGQQRVTSHHENDSVRPAPLVTTVACSDVAGMSTGHTTRVPNLPPYPQLIEPDVLPSCTLSTAHRAGCASILAQPATPRTTTGAKMAQGACTPSFQKWVPDFGRSVDVHVWQVCCKLWMFCHGGISGRIVAPVVMVVLPQVEVSQFVPHVRFPFAGFQPKLWMLSSFFANRFP